MYHSESRSNIKNLHDKKIMCRECSIYPILISGGLTASQFPVFTLYIQKVCLPRAPICDRAWTFEKVANYGMDKYAKKRGQVTSRQNCELMCLTEKEFPCR